MGATDHEPGRVVLLNGTPRAGKSSIAEAIQRTFDGVWMNLGVDHFKAATPQRFQPGIGLRPGGERPDLEPLIRALYHAMYESIAAHSRVGVNVVVDVGHHDDYSRPLGILPSCARVLRGLPVLVVGVRCPLPVVLERRERTWGSALDANGEVADPVLRWQRAVHDPGIYDLELDTSRLAPEQSARLIADRLRVLADPDGDGPPATTAIERLAAYTPPDLAAASGPAGPAGPDSRSGPAIAGGASADREPGPEPERGRAGVPGHDRVWPPSRG